VTWYNNLVAFLLIYMVTLFCVLPIGVKTADEAGETKLPGQADSAPANPRLGFKFLLCFGISSVIFAIYYVVGYYDLLKIPALLGRG
jgi:predicted secreted protein